MPLQPTFDLTKVSAPCRCRLPGLHGGSPGSAAAALCASACRRRVPEHGKRMGVTNAGLSAQPAHGNSACCPSAGIACNCYVAASGSRRGVTTPSSKCRDSCCATGLLLLLLLLAATWRVVLKAYVWLSTVLGPDTIHGASDELPDVQEPGQMLEDSTSRHAKLDRALHLTPPEPRHALAAGKHRRCSAGASTTYSPIASIMVH